MKISIFITLERERKMYKIKGLISNTVKSQLSECRLSETTGLFKDDGKSRLFPYYLLQ